MSSVQEVNPKPEAAVQPKTSKIEPITLDAVNTLSAGRKKIVRKNKKATISRSEFVVSRTNLNFGMILERSYAGKERRIRFNVSGRDIARDE